MLSVYVGTYTSAGSEGIYRFELAPETGRASGWELAAEAENPSFLAAHPNRRRLYAVGELSGPGGSISAYAVEAGGKLTVLNRQSSGGAGPCQAAVDPSGRNVLVANYRGGSVAVLPILPDGRLGEATAVIAHKDPARPDAVSHAHSMNLDPSGRLVLACDLGLDRIFVYRFDAAAGTLTPHQEPFVRLAEGAGPRHFAFHPQRRFGYVINELNSTITAFVFDASAGRLREIQTLSALPADFRGESFCSEIRVHPSGQFLYGANRGHDSIAVFAVDAATGRLTLAGHTHAGGHWPRHFGLDPAGRFLIVANERSGNLAIFRLDAGGAALTPTGQDLEVRCPSCVLFHVAR